MGKRKKFDKIERNETYYAAYGDESDVEEIKEKEPKKEKKKNIFDLNPSEVPEKKEPSAKFKYKKEKRKVVNEVQEHAAEVPSPLKAPFVLVLISVCLALVTNILMQSGVLSGFSPKINNIISVLSYVLVYVAPVVVYNIINYSRIKLHNLKLFSPSMLSLMAASFGLAVFLTALQKYVIAYAFSYSSVQYSDGGLGMALLMGALVPAICEELLVRGVFQHEISSYAGGFCGIVAGALVSGMLGAEPRYFGVYFVSGLVLGALTHVTRSCVPSMIVHFLMSTMTILFSEKLAFVATERIGGMLLMIILAVASFILLVTVLQLSENVSKSRAAHYRETEKSQKDNDKDNVILLVNENGNTFKRSLRVFSSPVLLITIAIFIIASVIIAVFL